MPRRYIVVSRRVERRGAGGEQLPLVCVEQPLRGLFSSDCREGFGAGKSWSVAPSAGCQPARVPHAAALELGSCACRENKGQKAPGRNAKSSTAVPLRAVGCSGFSVGAFASCSIPVPPGEGKPTGLVALPGATGGTW